MVGDDDRRRRLSRGGQSGFAGGCFALLCMTNHTLRRLTSSGSYRSWAITEDRRHRCVVSYARALRTGPPQAAWGMSGRRIFIRPPRYAATHQWSITTTDCRCIFRLSPTRIYLSVRNVNVEFENINISIDIFNTTLYSMHIEAVRPPPIRRMYGRSPLSARGDTPQEADICQPLSTRFDPIAQPVVICSMSPGLNVSPVAR